MLQVSSLKLTVFLLSRHHQFAGAEVAAESGVVIVMQSLQWFGHVERRKEREDTRAAMEMKIEGKRDREPKLW